ncbi:hypothetical protein C8R45DRAFT_932883 [Mycena sanguinolenta]|nr:hypothetical protein C8R45DRAFT_932883 [Mycena sanguinolenta]
MAITNSTYSAAYMLLWICTPTLDFPLRKEEQLWCGDIKERSPEYCIRGQSGQRSRGNDLETPETVCGSMLREEGERAQPSSGGGAGGGDFLDLRMRELMNYPSNISSLGTVNEGISVEHTSRWQAAKIDDRPPPALAFLRPAVDRYIGERRNQESSMTEIAKGLQQRNLRNLSPELASERVEAVQEKGGFREFLACSEVLERRLSGSTVV